MAHLAVVGATGRTGRLVVERALAAGHHVTAVARRPENLDLDHPRLTRRAADVLDPGALRDALAGLHIVVSALGSAGRGPTTVYSAGTAAIVAALPPDARLLVISSAGLAVPADAGPGARLLGRVLHRLMRDTYADMARMEELLAGSGLRWTAVRPTGLTDRPGTGRPRVSIGATGRVGNRTSRADLAAFVVDRLDDPSTFGRPVAVSS
ncbi:NAD(P)H-binding protein [Microbispora sp. NEAU-D428]|uniref:NAD(P)-dependent oxidoreductase n=1 Tax=Microbispora sitophila TaxID=2771537 RepID=UPI001869461A|nr:NAD(P)H-binding protein [Microbispora sitophila]MBE3008225.1 NAD(P)H-binding protein [Microbispora sitophila]